MPFVVIRRGTRTDIEIKAYQFREALIVNATRDGALVMFRMDSIYKAQDQADRYASAWIGARACQDSDVLQTISDMQ